MLFPLSCRLPSGSRLLLFQKAFVMTGGHIAFQRTGGVKSNADHDQQAGTAKLDGDVGQITQHNGQARNNRQEDAADQGDLLQGLGDEVAGGLAGADARDGAVVLAQLIADVDGVVLDRNIEVVETDDQQHISHQVHRAGVVEHLEEDVVGPAQEAANHVGQAAQRHGEDDGHNAGHIHLDGDVACLAAVHLTADHTLGVLYRDAALRVGQDDHEDHRDDGQYQDDRQQDVVPAGGLGGGEHTLDHGQHTGPVGHDAGEDQQGHTVADALGVNLVAHPGNQLAAGGEAQHNDDGGEHTGKAIGVLQSGAAAQDEVVGDGQHQSDAGAHIVGDSGQLAATLLPFLGKILQVGNGDSQQLHDNGRVDIRLNAQREDRALAERVTGHHVQVGQHAAGGVEHVFEIASGDIRYRNRTAQTEEDQDQQRIQKTLAQIVDLPGIAERFEHLRSPQLSRLPSRFFPWQRPCRPRPGH